MPLLQDDSQWPIVVDTVIGEATNEDIAVYNAHRADRLARAERHVQVIDGRSGARMSTRHRRMIADFDAANCDAERRYLAGVALVASPAVLRTILRAVYRITPSVFPRRACRSLDEATSWARSLL